MGGGGGVFCFFINVAFIDRLAAATTKIANKVSKHENKENKNNNEETDISLLTFVC